MKRGPPKLRFEVVVKTDVEFHQFLYLFKGLLRCFERIFHFLLSLLDNFLHLVMRLSYIIRPSYLLFLYFLQPLMYDTPRIAHRVGRLFHCSLGGLNCPIPRLLRRRWYGDVELKRVVWILLRCQGEVRRYNGRIRRFYMLQKLYISNSVQFIQK